MKKHHKLKNLYFFMAERREFSYTAAAEQQFPPKMILVWVGKLCKL